MPLLKYLSGGDCHLQRSAHLVSPMQAIESSYVPVVNATNCDAHPGNACLHSSAGASCVRYTGEVFLNAFVNKTRASQKIINSSGRTLRKINTPVLRNKAGNNCCRARNIED